MSFWTFGFHSVSPIESILDKEEFTLEDLLDEDEVLQECKGQNKRLLDFLCQPSQLKKLINYITTEPESEDEKLTSKFPWFAAELLCSEVWVIIDGITNDKELLDQLFSYLEQEPAQIIRHAQHVCRLCALLLERKTAEIFAYLKQRETNIVQTFLKHLNSPHVLELLMKFIQIESEEEEEILKWLCDAKLIPSLVDKFGDEDGEVHENASQALIDIVSLSNLHTSPLLKELSSEEIVSLLFKYILAGKRNSALLHGLQVLIHLCNKISEEHMNETSEGDSKGELPPLFTVTISHLKELKEMLSTPPSSIKLKMTCGEIIPLGFPRLKVMEFFLSLLQTKYDAVDNVLIELEIFDTCFDLFFSYHWNNLLHQAVDRIITSIFTSPRPALQLQIITKTKLLPSLIQAANENEEEEKKAKGLRRGYMGSLLHMASLLEDEGQKNEQVAEKLSAVEGWSAFVEGTLHPQRKIQSDPLVERPPTSFMHTMNTQTSLFAGTEDNDDDDEDLNDEGNELDFETDFADYVGEDEVEIKDEEEEEGEEEEFSLQNQDTEFFTSEERDNVEQVIQEEKGIEQDQEGAEEKVEQATQEQSTEKGIPTKEVEEVKEKKEEQVEKKEEEKSTEPIPFSPPSKAPEPWEFDKMWTHVLKREQTEDKVNDERKEVTPPPSFSPNPHSSFIPGEREGRESKEATILPPFPLQSQPRPAHSRFGFARGEEERSSQTSNEKQNCPTTATPQQQQQQQQQSTTYSLYNFDEEELQNNFRALLPNINISFSKGATNKWGNEEKGENTNKNGNNPPSQHQKQNQTQPIIWSNGDANVYKSWPHAASYPNPSSQQQHPFFLFHGEGKSGASVTSSHNESMRGHAQTTTQQQSHVLNRYEMLTHNNHPAYYPQQHNTNSNPAWMSYQTHAVTQNITPHSMSIPPGFNTQTSNHYANNHKIPER